jgi:transposase
MARKDRRTATTDARIELRKQVIELRRAGRTLQEISAITGYAATYCSTLSRKFGDEPTGLETLARGGRPTASGRALTAVQERQIHDWVCRRCPDQLQLPFALWTRRAVQTLISRRFGVKLSIHAVGEYLARWGYTPQKPLKRAYERDEARVRQWLSKEFPAIARRAKAEAAEINWGDETGLRSDESRHRGYAPRGQTPVVQVPARRKSLSLISAITNQGKVRFMIYPGALDARRLIVFMHRLTKDARRKVFLILDNLNVHKSAPVRAWLADHRDDIEVFFLPPYSPELNPDEYLNGDLKRAVHQDVPPRDREELKATALGHLRRIQKSPGRVRRYFRHRSIRYAAAQTSNARRPG